MRHHVLYHCGLDCHGNRHRRLKTAVAVRATRHHAALIPKVVIVARVSRCQVVWRTGLQRTRWRSLTEMLRAERRSFLATLPYPPLITTIPPRFG